MWLLRGLDFTAQAMRNSVTNKNEELATSFTNAYGTTLRPHHGMLIRPVFALAMTSLAIAKLRDVQQQIKEKAGEMVDGVGQYVLELCETECPSTFRDLKRPQVMNDAFPFPDTPTME